MLYPADVTRTPPASGKTHADTTVRVANALRDLLVSLLHQPSREMSLTSTATLRLLSRTGPRRITDVAAIAGITQPSATALVSTLERSGLVERRSDPVDKRVVLVAITPAGADYLDSRRKVFVESFAELVEQLPADQAAALTAAAPALEHLRDLDAARRDPTPPPAGQPAP